MLERMPVDHLTGFFSREALKGFLQENILEAASEKKSLYLTLVDLDRFKNFNDRFGHAFGDEILRYAAEVLRSTMGETSNYFFRYGGDEFIVVSLDKGPAEIVRCLKRYNSGTSYQPFVGQHKSYRITLSAGVTAFPKDAQTVDELIRKADKAMYFSKRHGRRMIAVVGTTNYIVMADIFMLLAVSIAGIYLMMYMFFNPLLASNIASYFASQAKRIKIVTKTPSSTKPIPITVPIKPVLPKQSDLDTVRLKDGNVYEGRILVNSPDEVIISVKNQNGETMSSLPASKIDIIKYGVKTPASNIPEGRNAEPK